MYVNNVRLYLKHLRRDLVPDSVGLPEAAHSRFLLQGANGSGKSTFLDSIATLWSFFGEWIDVKDRSVPRRHLRHNLANADMAAIEVIGLLPQNQSLWIGMGKVSYWVDLKDERPNADFAGLIQAKGGSWEIQLPKGDWSTFRERALVGSEPQPNIVYFPPEDRTVPLGTGRSPHIVDLMPYSWLAPYSSSVELESLLLTIRAHSPKRYDDAMQIINAALDNQRKQIAGFGPQGMIVQGRTEFDTTYEHPISDLSSGEKQMLLLIGFVATTLRDGGIVLIDEPDLHIHIVMVPQILGSIEAIVRERRGQLIVASHSQEVWDRFPLESEHVELMPWRGAKP